MRRVVLAAVAAAGLLAFAGQAGATIFELDLSGSVTSGVDDTGVFGFAPATDLSGQAFLARFTFDGALDALPADPLAIRAVPFLTADLTINGATFDFLLGESSLSAIRSADPGAAGDAGVYGIVASFTQDSGRAPDDVHFNNLLSFVDHETIPIGQRFENLPPLGAGFVGSFSTLHEIGAQTHGISLLESSSGSLAVTGASIGEVPAVPEPTAWALMILGFGGVGAALRRQRPLAA